MNHRPTFYCPSCHLRETPWGWLKSPDCGEICDCKISVCLNCVEQRPTRNKGEYPTIDLAIDEMERRKIGRRREDNK